jgi:IclR family transcriptional regulator, KDG regulon repressor
LIPVYTAMKKMQSITKALNILGLFLSGKDELAPGEIAQLLGMKQANVSHIIATLVDRGFLKQRKKRGKYSLGVRFLDISGVMGKAGCNQDNSIGYLLELSRLVNGSVYLTVWYGSDILLSKAIDYYNDEFKINPDEWAHMPLHSTCVGKIILASMNEKDLKKYFSSKPLEKSTPNTIVDIERMKEHLELVKREGIAFEDEESQLGVRGMAAGIKNDAKEIVGAIFVIHPSIQPTHDMIEKIILPMKTCALKISIELGYRV